MTDRKIERILEAIARASETAREELMIAESALIRIAAIAETLSRVSNDNLPHWMKQLNELKLEVSEHVNIAVKNIIAMNKGIASMTALTVQVQPVPDDDKLGNSELPHGKEVRTGDIS